MTARRIRHWRSILFVPADADRFVEGAHRRGADAIAFDLEDGVPPSRRAHARAALAGAIQSLSPHQTGCVVRINGGWRDIVADLEAAIRPGLDAIMVPKAESAAKLDEIGGIIGELELDRAMPAGSVALLALIESPLGLVRLETLAAANRVAGFALGSEDFALSMGVPTGQSVLAPACSALAFSAAAHNLAAFGLPISLANYEDAENYSAGARQASAMGLSGALCIHPAQVDLVNAAFTPAAAASSEAARIVELWDSPSRAGRAVITMNGKMVDWPVVELARRTLARGNREKVVQ